MNKMKKKIIALFMAVMIICVSAAPAFAAGEELIFPDTLNLTVSEDQHHLLDADGDTFSEEQAKDINEKAKAIYSTYGVDILILLADNLFLPDEFEEFGNKFYEENAYTDAAVVLVCDPNNFVVCAFGRAAEIFSDSDLDSIQKGMFPQEKYIDYYYAFLNLTGSMLKEKGVQPIPDERLLPRLIDNADLLTDSEESDLLSKLDEISERQQMDVVIVTINSLEGKTATAYADDFYDYNGYGFGKTRDGILLLVAMDDREWAISTCGSGIPTFTDAGQEYIVEQFKPDLSDGYYADAFNTFADLCDDYMTQAEANEPYDVGNMPKGDFPLFRNILIAVVVGFIIALIAVSVMKSKLTSVRAQKNATNYTVANSMRLTQNQDLFLYHVVTKTARPKNDDNDFGGGSSTHTSSSGSSHGGSSGSF